MKKILLLIASLIGFSLMGIAGVYAGDTQTVIVSEKVPGADCVPYSPTSENLGTTEGSQQTNALKEQEGDTTNTSVYTRKYKCTVKTGLAGFQDIFAKIIRWVVNIVMLIGVLAIVGVGIAWSLAGGDDAKAKTVLKKWGINIFVGMVILFFFRYILQFLAPWIYK